MNTVTVKTVLFPFIAGWAHSPASWARSLAQPGRELFSKVINLTHHGVALPRCLSEKINEWTNIFFINTYSNNSKGQNCVDWTKRLERQKALRTAL